MAALSDKEKLKLALLILESSSSDSSDDDQILELLQCQLAQRNKRLRVERFIENVVHNYDDDEFRKHFRVKRDVCYRLITDFEASDYYSKKRRHFGGKVQISAENQILSFLWFAGNKCGMRDVANRFGIAESTLFRQIKRVVDFLLFLAPNIIQFPKTLRERKKLETEFRKIAGFPGVIGCIDGSYINIRTPARQKKSTYTNRYDRTCITLQGICDAKGRYIHVFTGTPGNIHNARILQLSFINEELEKICGKDFHIIGDNAYPLREWILTPFIDNETLTEAQNLYNNALAATRVVIENSFCILKQRFQQLTRLDSHGVDTMSKFIVACCVIHNLCIDMDDGWDDIFIRDNSNVVDPETNNDELILTSADALLKRLGEEKRERIAQTFLQ